MLRDACNIKDVYLQCKPTKLGRILRYVWTVDASGTAAGALVVQDGKIEFNAAQSKYSTTRREALALLWAVQKFKHLMGWEHCRLDRSPTVGANWYRKF
jgi:hypothetical protein